MAYGIVQPHLKIFGCTLCSALTYLRSRLSSLVAGHHHKILFGVNESLCLSLLALSQSSTLGMPMRLQLSSLMVRSDQMKLASLSYVRLTLKTSISES